MKRRIHQNVWGNWNGYEGTHRVKEFGTDQREAERWVQQLNKPMNCSICLAKIAARHDSCNARPINNERCCKACDDLIVTPVRIARALGQSIDHAIAVALIMREKSATMLMQRRRKR